MSGEPVGMGEEKHPSSGNALLTTCTLNGSLLHTPLWIVQFATDLNLQIDSGQLRKGFVHRPVRFSERFLTFTTIWNVADRPKYIKLGENIKHHWAHNFNEDRPTPMIFKYFGASKAWKGFIENWEVSYAVPDVILSYTFNMRLALTPDKAAGNDIEIASVAKTNIPFAPTAGQVKDYGSEWYTGTYFEGLKEKSQPKNQKNGQGRADANKEDSITTEDTTNITTAKARYASSRRREAELSNSTDTGDETEGLTGTDDTTSSAVPTAIDTAGDQFKYLERRFVWSPPDSSGYFDPAADSGQEETERETKLPDNKEI